VPANEVGAMMAGQRPGVADLRQTRPEAAARDGAQSQAIAAGVFSAKRLLGGSWCRRRE
jgi:hypothetical protein